ncbi:MAG TPA: hypothetical protein PKW75_05940 [candidate division Zixibacteria bacterium]|nr:hypothetical protein [candidate division Zixibacteria bacterium]MDD4917759.1 hypothetical protein [candidate division Zixibacteria bacterium]MDM7973736.1 hypothetical protein [candidate division Zixibacteria bacterium]HOD67130.1 hypothetical protein [candidate division Zixibacteria bacterium]HOZ07809.1 hypothetical protein [candidate division Zixibacteria bacterium]
MSDDGRAVESAGPAKPAVGKARWNLLRFPRSWKEVRALGWRMIVAFIFFYLIRDTLLYIVFPYLAYKGIFD